MGKKKEKPTVVRIYKSTDRDPKRKKKKSSNKGSFQKHRLFYIDNLRIYLLILVFLTHTSIAYGGVGDWGVRDPSVDDVSPLFLSIFNAVNQSYFMSAFFLLAGYFTPRSVERKDPPKFLKDRVIRLVIPLIFYPILIAPINEYLIRNFMHYQNISVWTILDRRISHLEFGVGHLWFLQALLIFAIIYVVCRALADRNLKKPLQIYQDTFPPNVILFLCIGVLAVLTFAVRLVFPVGVWFLNLQLGHFVHYTFCFFSGVLAYRGNWFRRLSGSQARLWGVMSLVVIPLLFVIVILGGVVENVEKIMGGFYWQAFMYATWESFLMVGIIIFLLYVFRERLNEAGPIAKSMAANVYTVYIIHQTILYALQISMLSVNIPTIVKFFIVPLIAVPLCFMLGSLIRMIPYAKRVLG